MPVIALFDLRVESARRDDLDAVLRRILVDTRAFPGNRGVRICEEEGDPGHVVVVSEWEDAAANDAYLAWRDGDGAVHDLAPLLAQDPGGSRLVETHRVAA